VRRYARAHGRSGDHNWTANQVQACFIDQALSWHVSLDSEIQDDWKLLERAVLERFGGANDGQSSLVPTPTAAVSLSASAVLGSVAPDAGSQSSFNSSVGARPPALRPGKIRVNRRDGTQQYICAINFFLGVFVLGGSSNSIPLTFEFVPPTNLRLVLKQIAFEDIGVTSSSHEITAKLNTRSNAISDFRYETRFNVWRVSPDGSLSIHWDDDEQRPSASCIRCFAFYVDGEDRVWCQQTKAQDTSTPAGLPVTLTFVDNQ